jgi:hypothetical protein
MLGSAGGGAIPPAREFTLHKDGVRAPLVTRARCYLGSTDPIRAIRVFLSVFFSKLQNVHLEVSKDFPFSPELF